MSDELRAELANLAAAVRAHLEIEADLGNVGIAVPLHRTVEPAPAAAPRNEASPPPALAAAREPERPQPSESAPAAAPALERATGEEKVRRLAQLADAARSCTACVLHAKRKQSVFARGNPDAELVFVGEGPGFEEDQQGLPFVGPAGQLLDRMIAAMGYGRDEVYICNVVKCRPPGNRTPRPEEAIACARFLTPQLSLVAPKLIVALGRCAAENLGVAQATGSWRGRFGQWNGVPVLPTYHPAYLLRSPEQKRVVWEDLQLALSRLGRTPPPRRS
jgi:uracil-DNA glycosylase family 4